MSDEKKVFKDLSKFTVKRSDWLRGKGAGYSGLLRGKKMCCLGFYAKEQGFLELDLQQTSSPGELVRFVGTEYESKLVEDRDGIKGYDTSVGCALMGINDNPKIGDELREAQLKEKFIELGIEVEFVD